jgi:XrtN system VIT domain protein
MEKIIQTVEETFTTQKHTPFNPFSDKILTTGIVFLFISSVWFAITEYADLREDQFGMFILHYGLALVYTVFLIAKRSLGIRKSWKKENLPKTVIVLHLFLVSAFALNREITVFESSALWFKVLILVSSASLLAYPFRIFFSSWIGRIHFFLLGITVALYLYTSIYSIPFYGYGLIGTVLLGVGTHIFVPLFLLITTVLLIRASATSVTKRLWAAAGAGMCILFTLAFSIEWNHRINALERGVNNEVLTPANELPVWIKVAQQVQNDWITIRALKSEMVFTTWDHVYKRGGFLSRRVNWDEPRKHDPLVFIASGTKQISLRSEDRIKILQSHLQSTHQAEERLWNGDALSTAFVVSDIDIYPALRIAYTEKYLTIKNSNPSGRWGGQTQEAIYTFKLPEGSVITSLSLWVNGIEQKGILTSKQKATNAYKTIVGVESRDPSVVHWQEGNTITVRVFPCTPEEDRKFKIGITSPLPENNGMTCYHNITFEGPSARNALETVRVRFIDMDDEVQLPRGFTFDDKGQHIREAAYDPGLSFSFPSVPIRENRFYFDGYAYAIEEAKQQQFDNRKINRLYLDMNSSWDDEELTKFKSLLGHYAIYVFLDGDRVRLSNENWQSVSGRLTGLNFSLFPFYKLNKTEESVVVTKGNFASPFIKEFKDSAFGTNTWQYFGEGRKVNVFNLDISRSNYLNTLLELRALNYAHGSFEDLNELLRREIFPVNPEHENRVFLNDAKLIITKSTSSESEIAGNAPDHLARLFAYNNIMRKVGGDYFKNDLSDSSLVREASMAYVVSPVSSLIVLETQADYDRFDIRDTGNSLLNAAKQSSGAVPEPHEWALIVVFLLVVLFTMRYYKPRVSI